MNTSAGCGVRLLWDELSGADGSWGEMQRLPFNSSFQRFDVPNDLVRHKYNMDKSGVLIVCGKERANAGMPRAHRTLSLSNAKSLSLSCFVSLSLCLSASLNPVSPILSQFLSLYLL